MTSSARRGRKKEDIVISPELKELLVKKQEEEDRLLTLEKQLYNLEEAYMQQTYHLGNVVKGWDGYLSTRAVNNLKAVHRRIKDNDRIFTLSSVTGLEAAATVLSDDGSSGSGTGGGGGGDHTLASASTKKRSRKRKATSDRNSRKRQRAAAVSDSSSSRA